jgi:hypothetical protein
MLTFLRFMFVAIAFLILVAISHDSAVGTLDGAGAAGSTTCLLVIALAWRGMDWLEAQAVD